MTTKPAKPKKAPKEKRIFGHIPGVEVGQDFIDRKALAAAGVHKPLQAGISGSGKEGADSIVLSAGYEDDEDYGDEIIYTGAGGNDPNTGRQVADQELKSTNLALAKSCLEGLPVRVVRGSQHKSKFSPKTGYRYCGLYRVEKYWHEKGLSKKVIYRYRLVPFTEEVFESPANEEGSQEGDQGTKRVTTTVQRIVRDTKIAKRVKELHNYECQVCGTTIETSAGRYAEAAHIKPLGKPHNGPDVESNILCLCPNHHVMFDNGGFTIADDLTLIGIPGKLRVVKKHKIALSVIQYHRMHNRRKMKSIEAGE